MPRVVVLDYGSGNLRSAQRALARVGADVEVTADPDTALTRHIFESLAFAAGICLHVRVIEGRNAHHIVEAQFKAVARALRAAAAPDPRAGGIPSTKGVLS